MADGQSEGERFNVIRETDLFSYLQGTTTDEDLTRSDDINNGGNNGNNNGDDGSAAVVNAVVASASPTSASSKPKPKSVAYDEGVTPGEGELSEEKQEELNQIMSVYDLKRKKVTVRGGYELMRMKMRMKEDDANE